MKKFLLCASMFVASAPLVAQAAKVFDFMGFDTENVAVNPMVNMKPCDANAEIPGKASCSIYDDTMLGEARVSFIVIDLYGGKIATVIGSATRAEYASLLEVFTAKYGKPIMTKEDWRNGAGAVLPNAVATWKFKNGSLELKSIGSRLGDTDFVFINPNNQPPEKKPDVNF